MNIKAYWLGGIGGIMFGLLAQVTIAGDTASIQLQGEMRMTNYPAVIALADTMLASKTGEVDKAAYFKAVALLATKSYPAAVQAAEWLIENQPGSPWMHKAVFLKAQALVEQKQFKAAAELYEREASRLLDGARKQALASMIVGFADKLTVKPPPDQLDAPAPDFQKAYNLYGKALAMEIGRGLRDDILFKRARAIQQAGNPGQAIQEFQAYLTEFDPAWVGPAGSGEQRQTMINPPLPGRHIMATRFHLAEANLAANNWTAGRWEIEDLLKIAPRPDDKLPANFTADTRWLLIQSYHLQNADTDDVEQGIKSIRTFLDAHPTDRRGVTAAWLIPTTYERLGRNEDAIAAYREFIARQTLKSPDIDAARFDPDLNTTPAEYLARLKMDAIYRIGAIQSNQKRYAEAIATWQSYIKDFPNGPGWSACQAAIVNAEFQRALDTLADKHQDEAVALMNIFLRDHPLDNRSRQILYIFGQIHASRAAELEINKGDTAIIRAAYLKAIEEWAKLISKYPNTEESSRALFTTGRIYEEHLGDFEKALESYRKLTWGSASEEARQGVARMTEKSLKLTTERKFRTNEKVTVRLQTRNIEKAKIRIYKLDLQAYFRKIHGIGGVEALDVALIEPDKTWDLAVTNYSKFKLLEQELVIPFEGDQPGACIVNVSEDDWEASTLVVRSDLEMIVKCSRREILAFVQDMLTGKPVSDVEVQVSDGKAVVTTGKTNPDGVFKAVVDSLKQLGDVRVFAQHEGNTAAYNLSLAGLQVGRGLTPKGYLYTDRPAYRPGETVGIRGILRDVSNDSYAIPDDAKFTVSVTDAKGLQIQEQVVRLSRFGTFDMLLNLPDKAAMGQYTVAARQERKNREPLAFTGTFEVREFKLEKIKLSLDFPQRFFFRGEIIEGMVKAAYYWGEPVAGKQLRYTLPDGRIYDGVTDVRGQLKITFDTHGMRPGSPLRFSVALEGENVRTDEIVTLARLGFGISVKPSQPLVLAGEPVDVEITTTGADGRPMAQEVKLQVLHRAPMKADPVLAAIPWLNRGFETMAEVGIEEHKLTTDSTSGLAKIVLKMDKGGQYILRTTGTDRFGQTVTGEEMVEVSDADDSTKLRFFADSATMKVGVPAAVRLHSRLDKALVLLTFEGETLLRYQILPVVQGFNDIAIKVDHDLFPNFALAAAAIDNRDLRSASKAFVVERELKVVVRPLKNHYLPGESGQVELTVTDQAGKPVEAELSLALINEALFAVHPDQTPDILGFFQAQAQRHAEFKIGGTCGFRYDAIARPVLKEVLEESARLARAESEQMRLKIVGGQLGVGFADGIAPAPPARLVSEQAAGDLPSDAIGWDADGNKKDKITENRPVVMRGLYGKRTSGGRSGSIRAYGGGNGTVAEPRREVRGEGRWLPTVVTDAGGKAMVTIPMPETTTEWRLTARGCTIATLVGQATAQTLTRKDFFVELKAPGFLREGDEIRVMGRIHNLTEYAGPATVALRILNGEDRAAVLATQTQTVDIKARDGAELIFTPFKIPNLLKMDIELIAEAATNKDYLVQSLPVKPWGAEYAAQAGGVAAADTAVVLGLPATRKYSSTWLAIAVGPDLRNALFDMALNGGITPMAGEAIATICPSPWGEHPGSDLLAAAGALAYSRMSGAADDILRRLADRCRSLAASLIATQHGDGGWTGYGRQTGESDWAASCRVFWALIMARDNGIAINAETINRAAQFLQNQFQAFDVTDNDGKAMVLHALSCDKRADYANCNRIYRERNNISNGALAYLTHAFLNLDRKEIAAELAGILESRIPAGQLPSVIKWPGNCGHLWMRDDTETTALVLLALAQTRPDSKLADAAAKYLMENHGCSGFQPAKSRGPAVVALAAYFGKGRESTTDMVIDVQVNGTAVDTIKSIAGQGFTRLRVPGGVVKADKNVIEFKMRGRGRYAYTATLYGFSPEFIPPEQNNHNVPHVNGRSYYHAPLEYRGRPIPASSTSPVRNVENGQRVVVQINLEGYKADRCFMIEEPLPAGARLVDGSVSGNYTTYEVRDDVIIFYDFNRYNHFGSIRYELVGYAPGEYRAPPTVLREFGNPGYVQMGTVGLLTMLGDGVKSADPYQMNDVERFALGQCYFNDGDYDRALPLLGELYRTNRQYNERELVRMVLWIHTSPGFYDARKIVDCFEILRERHPQLEIPFDRIQVVARAYRDIGEFERAWLVSRAAIAASFANDSNISAVLEDEGRFLGSIDFQEKIWREYPDSADMIASYFGLTQALYQKAPNAHTLPKEDGCQPDRVEMLKRTADMLGLFLALYPRDPLADDASFSLANACLDLKSYALVVRLSGLFAKRYADSPLASSFQYMVALGHFWQNQYKEALAMARVVADGDSKDRDFARYILGQIYHAEGHPAEAIDWYGKVKEIYPDAAEAIAYFEAKRISLDEVTIVRPGDPVNLPVKYRNIKTLFLQVYRVDLMKLYLQQKNLSKITNIQLAGIKPELEDTVALGDGRDYIEKERKLNLKLKDEGAYLVICRGDDIFTSGMVLVTPLKIEVQEDPASGRVRANVIDDVTRSYRPGVHVKAIGGNDAEFKSGETDLRGIFIADNLHGKSTVIAREGAARYAFFRGETILGAPAQTPQPAQASQQGQQAMDFQYNLRAQNDAFQSINIGNFEKQRRAPNKGVQIDQAQ